MVTMEARKDIERNECECDDAQHNSGSVHGRSLLVDPVACEPSEVLVAVLHLCMHQVKISRGCRRLETST